MKLHKSTTGYQPNYTKYKPSDQVDTPHEVRGQICVEKALLEFTGAFPESSREDHGNHPEKHKYQALNLRATH
jgi:hypothetical protein